MTAWMIENAATIILSVIVFLLAAAAVKSVYKRKGACCGCRGGCGGCSACHKDAEQP